MLSDQNGHLVGRIHGLYIFLPQKTQRWKENIQLSPIGSSVSVPQNSSNGYLNVVFALSKAWMCLFITSFPYKHNLQKEVYICITLVQQDSHLYVLQLSKSPVVLPLKVLFGDQILMQDFKNTKHQMNNIKGYSVSKLEGSEGSKSEAR